MITHASQSHHVFSIYFLSDLGNITFIKGTGREYAEFLNVISQKVWIFFLNGSSDSNAGCNANHSFAFIYVLVLIRYGFHSNNLRRDVGEILHRNTMYFLFFQRFPLI